MLLQAEDLVLFVIGPQDVQPHRVSSMGFNNGRKRIFGLVHLAGLEHVPKIASPLFARFVGLRPVVDAREAGDILHIGHEARPDDVILVLEE